MDDGERDLRREMEELQARTVKWGGKDGGKVMWKIRRADNAE